MRKVSTVGKLGRLLMTAVMTCTLCVPTQALAAQDASGGSSASSVPQGENASPATSASENENAPLSSSKDSSSAADSGTTANQTKASENENASLASVESESVSLAAAEGNSSTGESANIVDWTANGTCRWMIDADGNLTVEPAEGATAGTLADASPWAGSASSIKTATFKSGVAASTSAAGMFEGCGNMTSVDLSGLGTSNVTDMSSMFNNCSSLTSVNLSGLTTSAVTNMASMFNNCQSLTSVNLSGIDTSAVTNMSSMFFGCSSLATLDLSGLNTSAVTNMASMLGNCSALTSLTLTGFTTSAVTDMSGMFGNCSSLKSIDLSGFDTSAVTNVASMFSGCKSLGALDLSFLKNSHATDMESLFKDCSSLATLDLSGLNTSAVTNMSSMFSGCSSLTSLDLTNLNTSAVTDMSLMFEYCSKLTTLNLSGLDISAVTSMRYMLDECTSLTELNLSGLDAASLNDARCLFGSCSSLTALDLSFLRNSHITDMQAMFCDCSALTSIDLSPLNTSNTTNMYSMFANCSALTSLDLSSLNTSAAINMGHMFYGCTSLTSLDLSSFDTSNAEYFGWMFHYCTSLKSVNLSGLNTSKVQGAEHMFSCCTSLTSLDLSSFDMSNAKALYQMFRGCTSLTSLDLSSFNTSKVEDMECMFDGCTSLASLDLSSFDTSVASNMDNMFRECTALTSVKLGDKFSFEGNGASRKCSLPTPSGDNLTGKWLSSADGMAYAAASVPSKTAATYTAEVGKDIVEWTENGGCMWMIDSNGNLTVKPKGGETSGTLADACPWSSYASSIKTATFKPGVVATSAASMFKNCENMTSVDLSGLDTSGVADMTYMFRSCKALTSIDVSCLDFSSVTDATMIFASCSSLASINLSGVSAPKLQNVTDMFWFCSALTSVDLSFLKGSPLTNINSMFGYCSSLTSLDLTPLDTSAVWDMHYLFYGCSSLTSLDLSCLKTSSLTSMREMFHGCSGLTSVNLSGFDTSKADSLRGLFNGCSSLKSVDVTGFKTSNVTDMHEMFKDCSALTSVDVSGFQTSGVTDMRLMFSGCSSLTSLDLSGFDTAKVEKMGNMFDGCGALRTVKLGTSFSFAGATSESMCTLPTPSGDKVTGNWVSSADGKTYAPADVPSNVAATYTAEASPIVDWTENGGCMWMIDAAGNLTVKPKDGTTSGTLASASPWDGYESSIKTATFKPGVVASSSTASMFQFCKALTSVDLSGLDTSNVTSMAWMFCFCPSLESLDLSSLNTSSVTNMFDLFYGCSSLKSLDLSSLNIANVTDMGAMFYGCSSLESLTLPSSDKSNVTNMGTMFYDCSSLKSLDLSGLGTSSVTDMSWMFKNCSSLEFLNLSSFDTSAATNMRLMFDGCQALTTVKLGEKFSFKGSGSENLCSLPTPSGGNLTGKWLSSADGAAYDAASVPSGTAATYIAESSDIAHWGVSGGCIWTIDSDGNLTVRPADGVRGTLADASPWSAYASDIKTATFKPGVVAPASMASMFERCENMTSVDLSGLDTSAVTSMYEMFAGCSSLASLDLSGLDVSKVTNMGFMFAYCSSLSNLNLTGLDASSLTGAASLFTGCSVLSTLDASFLKNSHPTNMSNMFGNCFALKSLDLSGLDTSAVTSMSGTFYNCSSLTTLNISGFDTRNVELMNGMFEGCKSLATIDVSGFNTSKVRDADQMFRECNSLTSLDLSSFDTSNDENMYCMFLNCSSLTSLDLSSFNTSKVYGTERMFAGCTALTSLNLSSFDTTSVSNMEDMFKDCSALRTVTLGDKFSFKSSISSSQCTLPTPSGSRLTGKWISSADGKAYDAADVPSNTAATYTAEKGTVPFPTAVEGLTYNGKEQTGVAADEYGCYKLYGDATATDAGTYRVTAVLEDGYKWDDQTTAPREITWTIAKAVVSAPVAATGLTYTGAEQTGVAAGEGYSLYGTAVATDAGVYTALAVLDGNHIWSDGLAAPKSIGWSIAKAKVEAPVAAQGLAYTGEQQTGVAAGEGYTLSGTAAATNAGSYTAVAEPDANHAWADGATGAKAISWSIAKATPSYEAPAGLTATYGQTLADVALPEGFSWQDDPATSVGAAGANEFKATYTPADAVNYNVVRDIDGTVTVEAAKVTVPTAATGLVYTGAAQTGVAADPKGLYAVEGGAQTAAGDYAAKVKLADPANYAWEDGTTADKQVSWSIARAEVAAPAAAQGLAYTGAEQTGVAAGEGYSLSGTAATTNAGSYTAVAEPDANHAWADGTTGAKTVAWSIAKAVPPCEAPAGLTAIYGQTLADVALPEGFSWQDDPATSVGAAGERSFEVIYTPADTANYESVRGIVATVAVAAAKVAVPTAATGLVYTGAAQTGVAADPKGLYAVEGGAQTAAGDYAAKVKLADPANYAWEDGTTADKQVSWSIARAEVEAPAAAQGLIYTGEQQTGVAAGEGYSLSGTAAATNAGSYEAVAEPDANHVWADGTTVAKTVAWSIAKAPVAAPVATMGLTYTGAEQTGVAAAAGYSLYGTASATDAGVYTALAVLDGNHIWSDGLAAPKSIGWTIAKAKVEAPAAAQGLTYTGEQQTGVASGEGYLLSGDFAAKNAGSYTAVAELDANHVWADGATGAKAISWSIAKADISTGKAEIEATSFVYMGRAIKPAVTVTAGGKTLMPGVDYIVTYSDNDAIGTAKATVTGMDNYDGALTADFAIVSKVVDVFSDANYGDWYVDFGVLDYAYAHGLVSGYSGTDLVGAYDFITRQDVAVILWRMAGEPDVAGGVDFADVDYGDYYGPAVRWARAAGVINGYQDADGAYRNFGPSDLVTREQLAVMIANYAGKVGGLTIESDCFNLNALPDAASVSDWARTSFGWCVDMGIISGVRDTVSGVSYAQPGNNAWRISMVSMTAVLHRDALKMG